MKFLSLLFDLPGLTQDLFNGAIIFRQWLDEGNTLKNCQTTPSKSELEIEDLRRKNLLQNKLSDYLCSPHYRVPYGPSHLGLNPSLKAASMIFNSSEALDALTQQKYIVREEGNYAAHNLISLERLSKALSDSDHMAAGPAEAMNIFVKIFETCIPSCTPLPPPAGSTLWTTSDPEWLSSPASETSPPPPAPALVPSSSSSHRGGNSGRSAKAASRSRSGKGRRRGGT